MNALRSLPLWVSRLLFIAVVLAVWQGIAWAGWINPIFIGDPAGIVEFLWEGFFVNRNLIVHLVWTIASTLAAFGLGTLGGVAVGLIFAMYPAAERFLDPFMNGLNALPRIALAPLFLLWFGLGVSSKIALGFSLTFFIVLASTTAGVRAVSQDHIVLARTLGASASQMFREITLPGAVPTIFSGLRLGLIYALLGVIGGEIIAAQYGLGQLIAYLAGTFQINGVFGVLFVLALLGTLLTGAMTRLEMSLLSWK